MAAKEIWGVDVTTRQWGPMALDEPMDIGGVQRDFPTQAAAVSRASTAQTISNNTPTLISWDTEISDTDGMVDIGGSPTRVTFKTAGTFVLQVQTSFVANATGQRLIALTVKNSGGTPKFGKQVSQNATGGSLTTLQEVFLAVVLAVDDYVEISVFQNSGGNLDLDHSGGLTYLLATRIFAG